MPAPGHKAPAIERMQTSTPGALWRRRPLVLPWLSRPPRIPQVAPGLPGLMPAKPHKMAAPPRHATLRNAGPNLILCSLYHKRRFCQAAPAGVSLDFAPVGPRVAKAATAGICPPPQAPRRRGSHRRRRTDEPSITPCPNRDYRGHLPAVLRPSPTMPPARYRRFQNTLGRKPRNGA